MSGPGYENHYKLEVKVVNAKMMLNNSEHPNTLWNGEQGNENLHNLYQSFSVRKGYYGYVRAKIRKDLLSNLWNKKRYLYYKEQSMLSGLGFSDELLKDIENLLVEEEMLTAIVEVVKKRGVYIIPNVKAELVKESQANLYFEQLVFTEFAQWRSMYYDVLLKFCAKHEFQPFEEVIPRKALSEISKLFNDSFSLDYLERRLNEIGFVVKKCVEIQDE